MIELYEKAELETIYLEMADVISTSVDPNDLYGTWGYKFDGGSESLTIRNDGTYYKCVKMSGYPDTKVDDAWSLARDYGIDCLAGSTSFSQMVLVYL